jgi:hypothetical protein
MINSRTLIFWAIVALSTIAFWQVAGKRLLSSEARERRRRRRNHRPAVRKGHGPAVKLAARIDR